MKDRMLFVMRIKSMSAFVFAGLILVYIVSSYLYAAINHVQFTDNMPFIFILRDLLLAILIASFWEIFLTDYIIKKMRYYLRIILFAAVLSILLFGFFMIFYVAPVDWAKLWLIVAGCIIVGLVIVSILGELYFRATGKQYTKILTEYKSKIM